MCGRSSCSRVRLSSPFFSSPSVLQLHPFSFFLLLFLLRIVRWQSGAQIQQRVGARSFENQERYQPSYNVGPMRFQPILIRDPQAGGRVLRAMRWGLVPFWSKQEPDYSALFKNINARDDSLTSNKPMFNHVKKERRCVVIADGFYEWLKDRTPKQPYFVKFEGDKILTMAGLYDVWKTPEGEELYTYTVVTTDPCSSLTFLHDRMPVLLETDEEIDRWLDKEIPFEEVKKLLRPYQGKLEIFPVSTFVSKIGNDTEECCKPITKKLEGAFYPPSSYRLSLFQSSNRFPHSPKNYQLLPEASKKREEAPT